MCARLVVGSSSLARTFVGRLRNDQQPLVVCNTDRRFLDDLEDDDFQGTLVYGEPSDQATLSGIETEIDSVLALDDDPAVTVSALETAAATFFRGLPPMGN